VLRKEFWSMENENDRKGQRDSEKSNGFGTGVVLGAVVGIWLFFVTVQILYWAK
jgi:hypothetical protein